MLNYPSACSMFVDTSVFIFQEKDFTAHLLKFKKAEFPVFNF